MVILRAVTRAGWATAGVLLIGTMIMVTDASAAYGQAASAVAPVSLLMAQLLALILMYLRPSRLTGALFIGLSVVVVVGYQLLLFTGQPELAENTQYLLNRPIVAMIAIGAVTPTPIWGIRWSTAALLAGEVSSILLQMSLGRDVQLGVGPLVSYAAICTLMLWLRRAALNQQFHVSDLRTIGDETFRLEQERQAQMRAAAVIHDTVLSDLSAIVHGRVGLPESEREHLRTHMRRLKSAMADPPLVAIDSKVDEELLHLVRDMQWKGLSVELSGHGTLGFLSDSMRGTALDAIRESLQNVLTHASVTTVDLFIEESPDEVMIMVSDQGTGFDSATTITTRPMPFTSSRIESEGGQFSMWSQIDIGTSVVFSLPKEWTRQS